jgi:hypothetical protein
MSHTPPHLTNLESALAGLAPSASRLNRDRMLYEAGKQAASRRMHWPITAIAFAGLSAVLGLQLFVRSEARPQFVKVVPGLLTNMPQRESESPAAVVAKDDSQWGNAFRTSAGYLSRRDQVLHFGADALPAAPTALEMPWEPKQDLKALHRMS